MGIIILISQYVDIQDYAYLTLEVRKVFLFSYFCNDEKEKRIYRN